MEDFKREILSTLRKDFVEIMKSEVKSVLECEVKLFRSDFNTFRQSFECFETSTHTQLASLSSELQCVKDGASACSTDIEILRGKVKSLEGLTRDLQDKCEQQESYSRSHNVRIVGVLETPGSCSVTAVGSLLKEAFALTEAPLVDRSHRAQAMPREGTNPRTSPRAIVARLHYYNDCANILNQARDKQRIKVRGMTISVFPDYTTRVAKARSAFNDVRKLLKDLEGVRFGIAHPAKFRVTYNGVEKTFLDPDAAETYVNTSIIPHATTRRREGEPP